MTKKKHMSELFTGFMYVSTAIVIYLIVKWVWEL